MILPEGVTKLCIFDIHTSGREDKWALVIVSEDAGYYICEQLGPLWHIFYEAYLKAKNGGTPGVSMAILYPELHERKGAGLCSFRHEPDRVIPNSISKGLDAYELETARQSATTNVTKAEEDNGLEILGDF